MSRDHENTTFVARGMWMMQTKYLFPCDAVLQCIHFCVMGHSFQFGTGPDPRVKATGVRWPVWISFLCAFSVIWRVVFGFCFCFCCCLVLCCCHRIVTVLLLRHCDCLPELCYANTMVGFTDAAAKAFATQSNCCN